MLGRRTEANAGDYVLPRPMSYLYLLLAMLLCCNPARASHRYWDADYDSLARTLPQQRTDSARLRTLTHLLDLRPTTASALDQLDQLLALNQRLHRLNDDPYRRLRAGLVRWRQGPADAAVLDSLTAAVDAFDRQDRPIPWLLTDLVTFYNRLNRLDARRQYYARKLVFYQLRGDAENVAACYISQGGYYRRMGDYNRTINSTLRAADMAHGFSRRLYINELLVTGAVYADWGNPAKALQYLTQARALPEFRRMQGTSRVFAFLALSKLYEAKREYPMALSAADSALAARDADPYQRAANLAYGLVQKSAVLLHLQQVARAGPLLKRARQLDDSLDLPMSDKPGEFEIDAVWAQYYTARHDAANAERHWLLAYQKAIAAKLDRLLPRYLKQLVAFYSAQGRPAEAQRYSHTFIALQDSVAAARGGFNVAQYEGERIEQAQSAQINSLRQARAVQDVRLRLRSRLLLGAVLATLLVSGLSGFIYWQLRVNRRTLAQLRQAQAQLVQAEKMAFLGELTAGIAHELQNPLTFMKNFAEVSTDLVDSMNGAGPPDEAGLGHEILSGLKQNLQQISQHGQRASSIIKDMLEHSRSGTGPRQPTDLNALADESLRLAYQGLRAKDKDFHATLAQELEPELERVAVVPQDLGRVLLNLCTNALYAVRQRQRQLRAVAVAGAASAAYESEFEPTVTVSTRRLGGRTVEIQVRDNGTGMPDHIREKVFQPFYTTKPAGEGTGLGLSLSHDIVTKGHGGTLTVESREGVGTEFIITLPA